MTTYIYARVSTQHQNVASQSAELLKRYNHLGDITVLEEKASGKNAIDRPVFTKLVANLSKGDTVIVYDMSRIGRNTKDVITFADHCETLNVKLIVSDLGEGMDVTKGFGKMITSILASVAEMQREQTLEKQAIGIADNIHKFKGKQVSDKTRKAVEEVKHLIAKKSLSVAQACKLASISRDTYYRLR